MAAIAKFIVFNSVLPLFDMGTDLRAFFFYASAAVAYHPNWAALTLFWITVPFVIHALKFLHLFVTTGKADWSDLFLHIPFVLPLRNLILADRLYDLRYGMSDFDTKDWAEVEVILKKVSKDGLSESFFESGPQATGVSIFQVCLSFIPGPLYFVFH